MGASECGPEWPSPCLMRHPGAAPPHPTVDGAVRGSFRATRPLARWSRTPSPPQAACVGLGQCSSAHDFRRQGRLGEPCPLGQALHPWLEAYATHNLLASARRKKNLPGMLLPCMRMGGKRSQTPATPSVKKKGKGQQPMPNRARPIARAAAVRPAVCAWVGTLPRLGSVPRP